MKKLTMKQAQRIVWTNGEVDEEGIYGKCSRYFQSQNYNNTGLRKSEIVRDVWCFGQHTSTDEEARKADTMNKISKILAELMTELDKLKDGTKADRDQYRKTANINQVGYVSSLLSMLGKESSFRSWFFFQEGHYPKK